MKIYKREGQVAERPHLNLPHGTYEEELGLDGFFGPVSHLYHRNAPTGWSNIEKSSFQFPQCVVSEEEFLKPQCYKSISDKVNGDFFESWNPLFCNEDLGVSVHKMTKSNPIYFRNSDASDLFFCHSGSAILESSFGSLDVKPGDYILVPKGVTYRWKTSGTYLLRIESLKTYYKKPETGILGQQALYHEEAIRSPKFAPGLNTEKESKVRVQKEGKLTEITYPFDIRDLSGWCGTLYPFILSVKDIAPIASPIAHLPPSVNSTFVTPQFIVCTFLPRPLEEPEGALKVPFYHSNIDYDEIIFYHEGDFFSRDNMEKAYITLHPRGVNHGPHPKALANQNAKKRTDEIAVMIDSIKPLKVSKIARDLEIKDYWKSWMKK
ncbi:MAG: homogentisate 1,2-dioxygenase [Deltaproteobacteria bacterium]|nr:homogentisate 1,2-dioxygenase [Deltaproteobacteria bacterium]